MYTDLNQIRRNGERLCKIKPLIAVVKADAYGVGAAAAAFALDGVAASFAVWTEGEAEELVRAGIRKDILVLGQYRGGIKHPNVVHTVCDISEADACGGGRVAVKVNTGMNRMGADGKELDVLLSAIARRGGAPDSIYTHLFCSADTEITYRQILLFDELTSGVDAKRHVAASKALGYDFVARYDLIRCGLALYAGAVTLLAKIIKLRKVKKGEYAGYGDKPLDKDTDVAVINIGYRDGYRQLTSERFVYCGGRRCRVINVCMDVTLIDVSGADTCVGNTVELLGKNITEEELGGSYGTTPYETYTFFGRVRKIYVG